MISNLYTAEAITFVRERIYNHPLAHAEAIAVNEAVRLKLVQDATHPRLPHAKNSNYKTWLSIQTAASSVGIKATPAGFYTTEEGATYISRHGFTPEIIQDRMTVIMANLSGEAPAPIRAPNFFGITAKQQGFIAYERVFYQIATLWVPIDQQGSFVHIGYTLTACPDSFAPNPRAVLSLEDALVFYCENLTDEEQKRLSHTLALACKAYPKPPQFFLAQPPMFFTNLPAPHPDPALIYAMNQRPIQFAAPALLHAASGYPPLAQAPCILAPTPPISSVEVPAPAHRAPQEVPNLPEPWPPRMFTMRGMDTNDTEGTSKASLGEFDTNTEHRLRTVLNTWPHAMFTSPQATPVDAELAPTEYLNLSEFQLAAHMASGMQDEMHRLLDESDTVRTQANPEAIKADTWTTVGFSKDFRTLPSQHPASPCQAHHDSVFTTSHPLQQAVWQQRLVREVIGNVLDEEPSTLRLS